MTDYQALARQLPQAHGSKFSAHLAASPRAAIETQGIRVEPFDIFSYSNGDCSCDGIFNPGPPPSIGYRPTPHSRRERFTLIHEFGHYAIRRNDDVLSELADIDDDGGRQAEERVCDAFAGITLIPDETVSRVLDNTKPLAKHIGDLFDESNGSRGHAPCGSQNGSQASDTSSSQIRQRRRSDSRAPPRATRFRGDAGQPSPHITHCGKLPKRVDTAVRLQLSGRQGSRENFGSTRSHTTEKSTQYSWRIATGKVQVSPSSKEVSGRPARSRTQELARTVVPTRGGIDFTKPAENSGVVLVTSVPAVHPKSSSR